MALKDKLKEKMNNALTDTLNKGQDLLNKGKTKVGTEQQPATIETKEPKKLGTVACKTCGAPVDVSETSCPYCGAYNGANMVQEQQKVTVQENTIQPTSPQVQVIERVQYIEKVVQEPSGPRCPYCGSAAIFKKSRSVAKQAVGAVVTGGLSLATLAIPAKHKCQNCGKSFKLK